MTTGDEVARPRSRALLPVAGLLGAGIAFGAALLLFMRDDSCPQWADEGPMAAPHSPYSRVLCAPSDPPFTWAWVLGVLVAVVLATLAVRRTRSGRQVAGWALVLLVVPGLVLGLLHLVLPQDCLGGRTATGECSRDREMR